MPLVSGPVHRPSARSWSPTAGSGSACTSAGPQGGSHVERCSDRPTSDTASDGVGRADPEPRPGRLLLSVVEAAELLGVSRAFAYELVLAGELPSVKLGRLRKVRRGELEAYVAALGGDG